MPALLKVARLLNRITQSLGGPGAGVDNLLLEDSTNILLEDGTSVFVLE